jgi:hypothetical protein
MRVQRSKSMGLAAGYSTRTGVWKVGDFHVADLTNGTVKIVTTRPINIVTREAFNTEFEAWKLRKPQEAQ